MGSDGILCGSYTVGSPIEYVPNSTPIPFLESHSASRLILQLDFASQLIRLKAAEAGYKMKQKKIKVIGVSRKLK